MDLVPINAEAFTTKDLRNIADLIQPELKSKLKERNFTEPTDRELDEFMKKENLFAKILTNKVKPPTSLSELDSADIFISHLSVDAALKLKIPFGDTDYKHSRKIFLQEYLKYTDLIEKEQRVRWGVGIRWIVNIKRNNANVNISSLPFVAASAHIGHINATARFQVIGISNPKIPSLMPSPTEFNVDTYADMKHAFEEIKNLIYDPKSTFKPKILSILANTSVNEDSNFSYETSLAESYALYKISERENLGNALDINKSQHFLDTVKSVYLDVAEISNLTDKPDTSAMNRALAILDGIEVDF